MNIFPDVKTQIFNCDPGARVATAQDLHQFYFFVAHFPASHFTTKKSK